MSGLVQEFADALDCCGTCAGGVLNRYRADAWDEGWQAAYADHRDNPYRDADHNPREEADKGARAGERGAEA